MSDCNDCHCSAIKFGALTVIIATPSTAASAAFLLHLRQCSKGKWFLQFAMIATAFTVSAASSTIATSSIATTIAADESSITVGDFIFLLPPVQISHYLKAMFRIMPYSIANSSQERFCLLLCHRHFER